MSYAHTSPFSLPSLSEWLPGLSYLLNKADDLGVYVLGVQAIRTAGVPFDTAYKAVMDKIQSTQSRIQLVFATGVTQGDLFRVMR